MIKGGNGSIWVNPSKRMVDLAIDRWNMCKLRADNTSIVTVMLDPPGPPRAQVLRRLHGLPPSASTPNRTPERPPALPPNPSTGIAIISRFPNSRNEGEKHGTNLIADSSLKGTKNEVTRIVHDSLKSGPHKLCVASNSSHPNATATSKKDELTGRNPITETISQALKCSPYKSPSPPPPLPARPANLKKVSEIRNALASQQPTNSNSVSAHTRTRNKNNGTPGPTSALVQSPAPALPVKKVRRSIVAEYHSDSENNQPKGPQTRRSCSAALRSGAEKADGDKVHNNVTRSNQNKERSRKSEPILFAHSRVLRPRNKDAQREENNATTDLNKGANMPSSTAKNFHKNLASHNALKHVTGGIKRKRRSLDPGGPAKVSRTSNNLRSSLSALQTVRRSVRRT